MGDEGVPSVGGGGGLNLEGELSIGTNFEQVIADLRRLGEVGDSNLAKITASARNLDAVVNKEGETTREAVRGVEELAAAISNLGGDATAQAFKAAYALDSLKESLSGATIKLAVDPQGLVDVENLIVRMKDSNVQYRISLDNVRESAAKVDTTIRGSAGSLEAQAAATRQAAEALGLSVGQYNALFEALSRTESEAEKENATVRSLSQVWGVSAKDVTEQLRAVGADVGTVTEDTKKSSSEANSWGSSFSKAALSASRELSKVSSELGNITQRSSHGTLGGGAGGLLSSLTGGAGALGAGLPGPFGALGAIAVPAGILTGLEDITAKTAAYSSEIMRNSTFLGLNTSTLQTLGYAYEQVGGGSVSQLTQVLDRFQRNLEAGAVGLKAMGLNLKDVGITSSDLNVALPELNKYLENNADQTQRNAVGLALLGRQGKALSQVLSEIDIAKYNDALSQFGVILNNDQLQAGAAADSIRQGLGVAMSGLEKQVGTELEAAFGGLELSIVNALGGGQQAAEKIGAAISAVVSAVASFIEGLFGLSLDLSGVSKQLLATISAINAIPPATDDANAAFDGTTEAVNKSSDALKNLRQKTKDQTDGIDDQISTLRQQQKVATDTYNDQKKAQQAADDAGTSYLSVLQAQLDLLTQSQDSLRRGNESMSEYLRRLYENQLKEQIKTEEGKRKQNDDTAKNALDAMTDQTNAQIDALNKQKQAIQDKSSAEEQSLQATIDATKNANLQKVTNTVGAAKVSQKAMEDFLKSIDLQQNKSAQGWGKDIHDFFVKLFKDPGDTIKNAAEGLAEAIGKALVVGMAKGIVQALTAATDLPWWAQALLIPTGIPEAAWSLKAAMNVIEGISGGGSVGGAVASEVNAAVKASAPSGPAGGFTSGISAVGRRGRAAGGSVWKDLYPIGEAGMELLDTRGAVPQVISHANTMQMMSQGGGMGGGDVHMHNHYHGDVVDEYVAASLVSRGAQELRRKKLGNRSAMGA